MPVAAKPVPEKSVLDAFREKMAGVKAEEEALLDDLKTQHQKALENVEALKEAQAAALEKALEEVQSVEALLSEMGHPINEPALPSMRSGTAGDRVKGARGDNAYTTQTGVEELCRRYPKGLSRGDLTGKLISELSYKSKSIPEDPAKINAESLKDFSNSVYSGGISKAMKDGTIFPVGDRGNTVYVHKDHYKAK